MQLFLDTTDVAILKDLAATGLVDGVTTNPTLIAKSGRPMLQVIAEICGVGRGAGERRGRRHGHRRHAGRGPQAGRDRAQCGGQAAADPRRADRHAANSPTRASPTNVTLCFSAAQALLAAKAGATYISPFIGRLDDHRRRRHGPDRRDPRDLRQLRLRHRDPGRLDPHRRAT